MMGGLTGFYLNNKQTLKIGKTTFFAENGMIKSIEDDGNYTVIPVRKWLHRAKAINDMLQPHAGRSDTKIEEDLRKKYADIVDNAVVLAKIAQEQGMPDDPSMVADRTRRQARKFAVSGGQSVTEHHGEAAPVGASSVQRFAPGGKSLQVSRRESRPVNIEM